MRALSVVSPRVTALSETLIRECSGLAANASEPNMFNEAWFLGPSLQYLRGDKEIYLIEARSQDGQLCGIMPLFINANYGRMPIGHVANWMHYQCFMGTPLVRAGDEIAFWHALLMHLDECDWARGLVSISGLLEGGVIHNALIAAAQHLNRPCPVVHRYERAALIGSGSPATYLETNVRPKKRKELRRLSHRLAEMGSVEFKILDREQSLDRWISEFLALESAGWKGERGSALGNTAETSAFFRDIIAGAFAQGKLDFQRLDLDGRAIAMLVNFKTPPGSWSFKIAYDESLARFSPGVLIELENLPHILNNDDIDWMDSCAVKNHPMINGLWGERRAIVQVSVPLSGAMRSLTYRICRTAEQASAQLRRMKARQND